MLDREAIRRWAFVAPVLGLTLIAIIYLARQMPTVQTLPVWFWELHEKRTSLRGLCSVTMCAVSMVYFLRQASRRGTFLEVLPFLVFGLVIQFGLASSEMRGIRGLRDRYLHSGHTQFAKVATSEPDIGAVLRDYESFILTHDLVFLRSKPPGTLLVYVLVDRASAILPRSLATLSPEPDVPERLLRAANMASFVFPLVSLLLLFPLAAISRRLLPEDLARWPLVLYVLAPPVELITLHIDQVLCPLIEVLLMLAVVRAIDDPVPRRAIVWSALAGLAMWCGLFVSFSLVPGVLLVFIFGALEAKPIRLAHVSVGATAGFVAASLLAYALWHYDPLVRFHNAMVNHENFKAWSPETNVVLASAKLDVVEFVYIVGLPVMAAFAWCLGGSVKRFVRRAATSLDRFAIATAVILALLPLTSKTQAEVARLWMFLLPAVVLAAVAGVRSLFPRQRTFVALATLAGLELGWMMALKRYSDFY